MAATAALTFDVDWAPESSVRRIMEMTLSAGVRSTWFITHSSPAIMELFRYPEDIEVGIHPNFMPNTTQGATQEEIFGFLKGVAPHAVSFRTHCLMQSTPMLHLAADTFGLRNDCSLLLSGSDNIEPHMIRFSEHGNWLTRIPFYFEDDFYTYSNPDFMFDPDLIKNPGLKVFNFHPLFLDLNIDSMDRYCSLKKIKDISQLTEPEIKEARNNSAGMMDYFSKLMAFLRDKPTLTMSEIGSNCRKSHPAQSVSKKKVEDQVQF